MTAAARTVSTSPAAAPAWAARMRRINDWLMHDLGGGPRPWKFSWLINFQKGATFPFLGSLMWFYSGRTPAATSTSAWVYLSIHGSYGLAWLLKDLAFPDSSWQTRITWLSGIYVLVGLGLYWTFGWLLISGTARPHYPLPAPAWFCVCISSCILGTVIMIAADAQKYFTLRSARGLIQDGMFKYVRHPNYLGEMMVYGAFALLVWHWFPVLVLAFIWGTFFSVNMMMKEASMARYPGWADYKRRTFWLVPGLL
jgi:protein-S-isoprenylcysteine O-methyltransferase Ste14